MISITLVLTESDVCTTTTTFRQLDIQLDPSLIRQTLRQQSTCFVCSTLCDTDSEDCLSCMHVNT